MAIIRAGPDIRMNTVYWIQPAHQKVRSGCPVCCNVWRSSYQCFEFQCMKSIKTLKGELSPSHWFKPPPPPKKKQKKHRPFNELGHFQYIFLVCAVKYLINNAGNI